MVKKDLDYYLSLPYVVEFTPNEDGFWFAEIPLLEGCMTNGGDIEDAFFMKDAQRGWLMFALDYGDPIPEPETEKA